ncbi:MAG: hypothetical protein ACR65R_04615 [Methylomicrobium sp.]|jgi:hypothetical protein
MTSSSTSDFKHNYQTHLKHLKLKGLQPKTIDAYARAIRRIGQLVGWVGALRKPSFGGFEMLGLSTQPTG